MIYVEETKLAFVGWEVPRSQGQVRYRCNKIEVFGGVVVDDGGAIPSGSASVRVCAKQILVVEAAVPQTLFHHKRIQHS